jgi:hypothetical protein
MFEYEVKRSEESSRRVPRKLNKCCECGETAIVSYDLKGGPEEGSYGYCFECAVELQMLESSGAAAMALAINPRTVRTWCGDGRLEAYKDSHERWWVVFDPHGRRPVGSGVMN